ncbi:2-hydroxyacid dehydrogenase [Flexibacterium corallicola]|uniref:2-hydroxyacid dehydrogenase n=1 Tax=Flexibacterium corallicola TaxID=3037259 RepID=UPI00286F18CF|nr:glyoxylate/hydroxypyruvate reductase A [Pseudovibrio sp. M1P-2-3]
MSVAIALSKMNGVKWKKRMESRLPNHQVQTWPNIANHEEIKYLLAWKPPADVFETLPNLEVIFSLGAGVDHLIFNPQLPTVPVVRIVDTDLTDRMTEWVTLQVLLHHRQHLLYAQQQKERMWKGYQQLPAREVHVGILGLGELGAASAVALRQLGFQVSGWSRSRKELPSIQSYAGQSELFGFLQQTNILVNLLPHTQQTQGLIDYELLTYLSRSEDFGAPVYINAGRGGTQNEKDLARALQDGTLKGASIDVFSSEPLSPENPLWQLENCIVTPHVASESDPNALSYNIAEQITAYEQGQGLKHTIDWCSGY